MTPGVRTKASEPVMPTTWPNGALAGRRSVDGVLYGVCWAALTVLGVALAARSIV